MSSFFFFRLFALNWRDFAHSIICFICSRWAFLQRKAEWKIEDKKKKEKENIWRYFENAPCMSGRESKTNDCNGESFVDVCVGENGKVPLEVSFELPSLSIVLRQFNSLWSNFVGKWTCAKLSNIPASHWMWWERKNSICNDFRGARKVFPFQSWLFHASRMYGFDEESRVLFFSLVLLTLAFKPRKIE